ncbi:DUF1816 domain-containing protein [Cyanobacterium sp. Dongsha4]|uniref:DUF1816 domain-containing protein n=1 Tax=Cyanobacterium sp. DS4 TaxID=2878255 RepID=UPI002E822862|nr:DUF1816 domain-containing protein [Cyanobacterium sp. Dongsha4]WVK99207.1 DUF1816 domain-containing protein [Cyanobacterium sp. Dongsha4]
MREQLITVLDFFGLACWLEITTNHPECIYYFGPFLNQREAQSYTQGYIEDLKEENAIGIIAKFRRCKPKTLTIFDEDISYSKSVSVV